MPHMRLQGLSIIQVTLSSDFIAHHLDKYMKFFFAEGGIPFICGGGTDANDNDLCYKYVAQSDNWVISGTMAEERANHGYGSSESWGLVMAGGYNDAFVSSVESTKNGEIFGTLPDLEIEVDKSCVVVIDDSNIFTCGGYDGNPYVTDTFIYSNASKLWSR